MDIKIIATTKPNEIAKKDEFDIFSGRVAGVCYMTGDFGDLCSESLEKTNKRVGLTKGNGHHSVYDHEYISLYLENIPKALAMVLNNEKMYTTSEKSARYTKMSLSSDEQVLFDKWVVIFNEKIKKAYQEKYPMFFTDKKIEKLAQENARYLISVFTPTKLIYTTSYRQFNYIYGFLKQEIDSLHSNSFYTKLKPYMIEFCDILEKKFLYLDKDLQVNEKKRGFSFFSKNFTESNVPDLFKSEEYFGEIYLTNCQMSFACLAQAQRHRTINYSISKIEQNKFYVPKILSDDKELVKMWLNDMEKVKNNFPQGMMLNVVESGTFEKFVDKMKERKCTFSQLEINNVTSELGKKYYNSLKNKQHFLADTLINYIKGSRCTFPDYKCMSPCCFPDGVIEKRNI